MAYHRLNAAAVDDLNQQRPRDYYRGYYGASGDIPTTNHHKQLIREAVGCQWYYPHLRTTHYPILTSTFNTDIPLMPSCSLWKT
jgi:hypothetical protein